MLQATKKVFTGLNPIENYYRMVYISAGKIFKHAKRNGGHAVPADLQSDLTSCGMVALINAYKQFNPNKNASFATYVFYRVRGAMYDYLRNEDVVPRGIRDALKHIKNTSEGKVSTSVLSDDQVNTAHKKNVVMIQESSMVASEHPIIESAGHLEVEHSLTIKKLLSEVSLTEKERHIVNAYYFKEQTFSVISKEMSITESRVSQLHTSALNRLKSHVTRTKLRRNNTSLRA